VPGDRDRLDRDAGVLPDLLGLDAVEELDHLGRVRRALLELDAGVQVLVVLAHHHQVDVLVPGADPPVGLARPQAGVQVQLLAQGHVDAAEPGADRGGQRPLDGHAVAADGVQHVVGQGRAVLVDDLGPGLLDVPVERHAGALEDPAGRLRQLRSDPVPGDERDAMGHGGSSFARSAAKGISVRRMREENPYDCA
jgi:hypothetical protein